MTAGPLAGRRILFAGWRLAPFGGLETRVTATVALARAQGMDPRLTLVRPVPPGSQTAVALGPLPVDVAEQTWRRSARGRILRSAGLASVVATKRRPPTPVEREQAANRSERRFVATYFDGPGRALLEGVDLVHLVGPPMTFSVSAMQAAHRAGIPVLYQAVHQVDAAYAAQRWRKGFVDTCNDCDLILTTHDGQAADFAAHFHYRGATQTIPQWAYGIEPELLALEPVSAPLPRTIGTLCRFDVVKRVDLLLRAFAQVAAGTSLRLRLGGVGEQDGALRALAGDLGIADRVDWLGYTSDREAFYRDVDVFAITSSQEGGPVTGVEALAAGRAVISTAVGAMPERLAGDAGVVVPVDDLDALTAALRAVVTTPGRAAELAARARARYLADYRESACEERILHAWRSVLG